MEITIKEEETDAVENVYEWPYSIYDSSSRKDRVAITYEKIPFNMLGNFKSFDFWDKDLIMTCVEFRRCFGTWPTAILANDLTYDRWEDAVRSQLEDLSPYELEDPEGEEYIELENSIVDSLDDSGIRLDLSEADTEEIWKNFDTNIPLDQIKPEGVPIEFGIDFATPFFRLTLLVDNNFEEGKFRLMFGEGPGTDDGEEIPDSGEKIA